TIPTKAIPISTIMRARRRSANCIKDFVTHSSLKQNLKAFLGEMAVVREQAGNTALAHHVHRNAVGEAVAFVGARFAHRQATEKSLGTSRYDFNLLICEYCANR